MRSLIEDKRGKRLERIFSLFLTAIAICLIVFSGPVSAVRLGLTGLSNSAPSENTQVSFIVYADIEANENVPIKNLTVAIGSTNCTFAPDATELAGDLCNQITVSKLVSAVPVGYGYSASMWGYGYTDSTPANYTYGSGYGYAATSGYAYTASPYGELAYNITWTTPGVSSNTAFTVVFSALVVGNSTHRYSKTQTNYITVNNTANNAPAVQGISISPAPAYTNSTLNCSATLTDEDGNKINASFTWYNGSTAYTSANVLNAATGSVASKTLTAGIQEKNENWNCSISAYDGTDNSTLKSTNLTISNYAPILASIGSKQVNATSQLNFTISATDGDNDTITYTNTTTTVGNWAIFNKTATNLTFVGTPTALQNGTYNITFIVSDGTLTDLEVVFITVLATLNQSYADNQTETVTNTTTEVIFNGGSTTVENITIPSTVTANQSVTLNFNALMNSSQDVEINTRNLTLKRETSSATYTVEIQNGTIISGNSTWDGKITMPTVKTASDYSVSGGTIDTVIDLGTLVELNFSKAVKITLSGQAGKNAAWGRGTTLTDITTQCNSATNPTNIYASSDPKECYIDSGSDLLIWTYHFTQFAAYTATAATTTTAGTGGGGIAAGTVYDAGTLATAVSKELSAGDKITFTLDNRTHKISLIGMTGTSAVIQITAVRTILTKSFKVGDTQLIDVTEDGKNDIEVTLKSINLTKSKATFEVRSLFAAAPSAPPAPEENVTAPVCGNAIVESGENCETCPSDVKCAADEECKNAVCAKKIIAEKKSPVMKWILIASIIIVAIIAVILIMKVAKKK